MPMILLPLEVLIIAAASIASMAAFAVIIWYVEKGWKVKVVLLSKIDKAYVLVKEKRLYSLKDSVKIGGESYILKDTPSYYNGHRPVYVFEKGNGVPLYFGSSLTVDARKLAIFLGDEGLAQLVKAAKPFSLESKNILWIVIAIAAAVIILFLLYPQLAPAAATASQTPTLTPKT